MPTGGRSTGRRTRRSWRRSGSISAPSRSCAATSTPGGSAGCSGARWCRRRTRSIRRATRRCCGSMPSGRGELSGGLRRWLSGHPTRLSARVRSAGAEPAIRRASAASRRPGKGSNRCRSSSSSAAGAGARLLAACGESRTTRVITGAAGGAVAGEVIADEPVAGAVVGGVVGARPPVSAACAGGRGPQVHPRSTRGRPGRSAAGGCCLRQQTRNEDDGHREAPGGARSPSACCRAPACDGPATPVGGGPAPGLARRARCWRPIRANADDDRRRDRAPRSR